MAAKFLLLGKQINAVGDVERVEANIDDAGNVTICRRILKKGAVGWTIDKVTLTARELKILKENI